MKIRLILASALVVFAFASAYRTQPAAAFTERASVYCCGGDPNPKPPKPEPKPPSSGRAPAKSATY